MPKSDLHDRPGRTIACADHVHTPQAGGEHGDTNALAAIGRRRLTEGAPMLCWLAHTAETTGCTNTTIARVTMAVLAAPWR